MATFGEFSLLIALALAAWNLLAGAAAVWTLAGRGAARGLAPERLAATARRAGVAGFVAASAASLALLWAVFANDFTLQYVIEHSNRALPGAYKFAALWAGQEGSLLFWVWLLSAFGLALRRRGGSHPLLDSCASAILAAVQLFFLLLVNFVATPFALNPGLPPDDGSGLNPLLQYPEMVIHPPLLYLGYVGFAIPFALVLAALLLRLPGEQWLRRARRWTLIAWLLLTCGIFLGMHWAYAVLGWGGYWGWDPVENASFLPWLTATAFLHTATMQERRGMMKSWNVWLLFLTFLLTVLGTTLTRSGLVSSVHAFAASSIGDWFLAFLVLTLAFCLFVYLLHRDRLRSAASVESLLSREASYLFNSLVLLAACLVILWGTLYPVLSEAFLGGKITLDASWYNAVTAPIGLFLLLLTGVGPLLPWRSPSWRELRRSFLLPVLALWATAILCVARFGWPWKDGRLDRAALYALVAFALGAGVAVATLAEFARGAALTRQATGLGWLGSLWDLVRRNKRRYGGYIVHLGVALTFAGLAGAAFNQSTEAELPLHGKLSIGPYTLECQGFTQDANANYQSEYVVLDVWREGRRLYQMTPERRVYLASQQPQTMVAVRTTLFWDLYVVYEGVNPDTEQPVLKAFLNPLVGWIWAGFAVMTLGAILALLPNARPQRKEGE